MPNHRNRPDIPSTAAPAGGETTVLVCMALVVAAVVVGLNVQMGLSLVMALAAGASLFVGLAGIQAWRRGEAERAALADELSRLEAELGLDGGLGTGMAPNATYADHVDLGPPTAVVVPSLRYADHRMPVAEPGLVTAPAVPVASARVAPRFEAYRGAPDVAPGESFNDYWQGPVAATGAAPGADHDEPETAPVAGAAHSAVREDDVEMLQRRIKDMLYQVAVAEQTKEIATAMPDEAIAPPAAPQPQAGSIDASINALQAAVSAMRQPMSQAGAETHTLSVENQADRQRVAVQEAIAAGRVDVFLEPILALGDQAAQHYEVSIKLHGEAAQDLGAGDSGDLVGRGLLPLFDAVRIDRSALVAERLMSRGKTGAVFSRASGEALIEPEFTRNLQIDFVVRPATAGQLILTFSQADIRSFRAAEQRAVSALSALGFRFAIAGLTDLDMNFAAMAQAGFGFVKVDAPVLLHGLPHPGGLIPAGDVCRFLADQGFGLIVEGIDSEEMLAQVFGFGVLMGQGTLFGGRRPVKTAVTSTSGQAAA